MNLLKYYLKTYYNIIIKHWGKRFSDVNWAFFKKHNVTLQEMLANYKLADKIEEEFRQPIPDVEYRQGKGHYKNKYNPDLILVVEEF